jgi:hypothetical protein
MDQFWTSVVTVATAIVGLAIIAVLVSQRANTANVISSAARGFAEDLGAAVSPVTGGSSPFAVNFGGQGGAGFAQGY